MYEPPSQQPTQQQPRQQQPSQPQPPYQQQPSYPTDANYPARQPQPLPPYAQGDAYGSDASDTAQGRYFIALAKPTVTWILIAINVITFVVEIVWGIARYGDWQGSTNLNVLIDLGAKVNENIAFNGEIWRLFTAMFLHIGVLHLIFNLYALYAIGTLVEAYYGHWRFLAIYMVGGLFGSLGSYAYSDSVSAGASGAIFAITGAAAVYFFLYRENFGSRGRSVLQNIITVIVITIGFGMLGQSGVDNWGHIGGLVGGVLLGWGLAPRYERSMWEPVMGSDMPLAMQVQQRRAVEIGWVVICVILLGAGVYLRSAQMIQDALPIFGS